MHQKSHIVWAPYCDKKSPTPNVVSMPYSFYVYSFYTHCTALWFLCKSAIVKATTRGYNQIMCYLLPSLTPWYQIDGDIVKLGCKRSGCIDQYKHVNASTYTTILNSFMNDKSLKYIRNFNSDHCPIPQTKVRGTKILLFILIDWFIFLKKKMWEKIMNFYYWVIRESSIAVLQLNFRFHYESTHVIHSI